VKTIYEVLRQKEEQSLKLQKEVEALRVAIKILDEADSSPALPTTEGRSNGNNSINESVQVAAGNPPTKRFP